MSEKLLEVRELKTQFFTDDGIVAAVNGVSFDLSRGETLGLVGESGCGKSVTSLSLMRLVRAPGRITGGQILWKGQDLATVSEAQMRDIRGNDISMIFQEPMTSLDPLYTIGDQIGEALRLHQNLQGKAARDKAVAVLKDVGIADAEARIDAYPHQMSGGMRQRVMIAIALSCDPDLLIADEPTTALDVTIQARILDLLRETRTTRNMALLLITHNLGIVAEMCDRVAVMHGGKIVEQADVESLFARPRHPYTIGLLGSIPTLSSRPKQRLATVDWEPTAEQQEHSNLVEISPGHLVSAWAV